MTPEEIIDVIVEVAGKVRADEKSIIVELRKAGLNSEEAILAFNFTKIAWGRGFLGGMNITFTNNYYCFDAKGEICDSGHLGDQPVFVHAFEVVRQHNESHAFNLMAQLSSEVKSINEKTRAGLETENLTTSPACICMTDMPEYRKVQLQRSIEREHQGKKYNKSDKPWWKFWGE